MAEGQKKRSNLGFIVALLALLGTIPLAWKLFLSGEAVKPPPPQVAVADSGHEGPVKITLSEVQGEVEIRDATADGGWRAAKAGDELKSSAGVRTKDGAMAVMVGGERWEVRIEPGTEVEVGELSDSISRLLLANGMAHAKVKGGNRHAFEVKATQGDAVARTDAGVFSISHNGEGTVAVGTQEGEVEFLGKGKVVIVRAGQGSIIHPGQAPSEPAPLPSSLLLKVNFPKDRESRQAKVVITGTTVPGSVVTVEGKNARVDAEGNFKAPLTLQEGQHRLDVRAVSVGNQTATESGDYKVKRAMAPSTVKVPWGKKR
jgi:Glucodextranase, domain B/FecR protein